MNKSGQFTENMSYKLVALFIALILWLTILGRRDFEAVKTVPIQITLSDADTYYIKGEPLRTVEVKISGNRRGLKEFEENIKNNPLKFTVSRIGYSRMPIRGNDISLPQDVRLLWVRPDFVEVTVRSKQGEKGE